MNTGAMNVNGRVFR